MPPWAIHGASHAQSRSRCSGWWRKITKLVEGEEGKWFWEHVERKLGNGNDTHFWEGSWMGASSLKSQYPRLYHLCQNKEAMVSEMGSWEHGKWIWNIPWRRDLRSSEKNMVEVMIGALTKLPLSTNESDCWVWKGSPKPKHLVKTIYQDLERSNQPQPSWPMHHAILFNFIWKSVAPFKAQVMVWRLIWNRLPTMDNLSKHINTSAMDRHCIYCSVMEESSRHIFVGCSKVRVVWDNIVSWVGINWAAPNTVCDHLHVFINLLGKGKTRKMLTGLWICSVWVWWKWRNGIMFERKRWDLRKIIEEIKCRFWNWCVVRGEADPHISFATWSSTKLCLR